MFHGEQKGDLGDFRSALAKSMDSGESGPGVSFLVGNLKRAMQDNNSEQIANLCLALLAYRVNVQVSPPKEKPFPEDKKISLSVIEQAFRKILPEKQFNVNDIPSAISEIENFLFLEFQQPLMEGLQRERLEMAEQYATRGEEYLQVGKFSEAASAFSSAAKSLDVENIDKRFKNILEDQYSQYIDKQNSCLYVVDQLKQAAEHITEAQRYVDEKLFFNAVKEFRWAASKIKAAQINEGVFQSSDQKEQYSFCLKKADFYFELYKIQPAVMAKGGGEDSGHDSPQQPVASTSQEGQHVFYDMRKSQSLPSLFKTSDLESTSPFASQ